MKLNNHARMLVESLLCVGAMGEAGYVAHGVRYEQKAVEVRYGQDDCQVAVRHYVGTDRSLLMATAVTEHGRTLSWNQLYDRDKQEFSTELHLRTLREYRIHMALTKDAPQ